MAKKKKRVSLLAQKLLGTSLLASASLYGNPENGTVVQGDATFSSHNSCYTIEASNNSILHFDQFNIAKGETVQFIQPGKDSCVLTRVTGREMTQIDGALTANGRVYLVNPYGIYLGKEAIINTAGFFAIAGQFGNDDFLSHNDYFTKLSGSVVNEGTIISDVAALIGNQVANHGSIICNNNLCLLVSDDNIVVGEKNGQIFAKINKSQTLSESPDYGIINDGSLTADRVVIGASDLYGLAISHTGKIKANSVDINGQGVVMIEGEIDASSTTDKGGAIHLLGEKIGLVGATIDASGLNGGGEILVGGEYKGLGDIPTAKRLFVSEDSQIKNSAIENGDGGRTIFWSDEWTCFGGQVEAKGGLYSGNGGFVETSSGDALEIQSRAGINLDAPQGKLGEWLLDPTTIQIVAAGGNSSLTAVSAFGNAPSVSTIDNGTINAATGNVTMQALQTITVDPANAGTVSLSGKTLTLQAGGSITLLNSGGWTLNITNGDLIIALRAIGGTIATTGVTCSLPLGTITGTTSGSPSKIQVTYGPIGSGTVPSSTDILQTNDSGGGLVSAPAIIVNCYSLQFGTGATQNFSGTTTFNISNYDGSTSTLLFNSAINVTGSLSFVRAGNNGPGLVDLGRGITSSGNMTFAMPLTNATASGGTRTVTSTGGSITLNSTYIGANASFGVNFKSSTGTTFTDTVSDPTFGLFIRGGDTTFESTVSCGYVYGIADTSAYTITFQDTVTNTGATGVAPVYMFDNGSVIFSNVRNNMFTGSGGFSSGLTTTVQLRGTISTNGNPINIANNLTLVSNSTLSSSNGNTSLGTITGGGSSLTIQAGTGAFECLGAVSGIANLNISTCSSAVFSSTLSVISLTTSATAYLISFNNNVTVSTGASTLFRNTGPINFVNPGSTYSFNGGISVLATPTVTGTFNIQGTIIAPNGAITLGTANVANATLTSTTNNVTITGTTTFSGGSPLTINATSSTASITLGPVASLSSGSGNLTLNSPNITLSTVGTISTRISNLSVNNTNNASINNDIYSSTASFAGPVTLNKGSLLTINTTGTLSFQGIVTLSCNTALTSGPLTFSAAVNQATVSPAYSLSATCTTLSAQAIGTTTRVGSLTITNSGIATLNGNILATGNIQISGTSAISASRTIDAGGTLILNAINISNTPDLILNSGSTMSLLGAIGSSGNRLNSITITNGGALTLSGGIYTVNNQGYAGNITLSGATTLDSSAGQITQTGTIAMTGSSLTVNTINAISLGTLTTSTPANVTLTTSNSTNGTISVASYGTAGNPLGAISITNAATNTFNGSVYGSSVAVSGASVINANLTILTSGAQSFGTINSAASTNYTLALNTGSTLSLGAVGATRPVGELIITNTGNATLNGDLRTIIGTPTTTGNISISGTAVVNTSRSIDAGGDLTLHAVTTSSTPTLALFSGRTTSLLGAIGSTGNRFSGLGVTNTGTLTLSGGVYTINNQRYQGNVALTGATTLDASNGMISQDPPFTIALGNNNLTINAVFSVGLNTITTTTSGQGAITITTTNTTSGTVSLGSIGSLSVPIGALSITNAATNTFNGSVYAASVAVSGASVINTNLTILSSGAQSFGTINSLAGQNYTLALNTGSTLSVGAIGAIQPVGQLTITNTGIATLNGNISAAGNISISGTAAISASRIINAGGSLVLNTINITNTPDLTLTSGSTMSLLGAIGSSGNRLNSITITNGGALTLSGGIYTVNNQGYAGNITLSGATILDSSAGQITQTGTIALAGSSLTVNTVNAISLGTLTTTTPANVSLTTTDGTNGTVSSVAYGTAGNPLGAISITNAALNTFNGSVYGASVAVSGASVINTNLTILTSGAQSYGAINSQTGTNYTLALNSGSTLSIGAVGATRPVGELIITNTGNATLNGDITAVIGSPTTTGNISISGTAVINASRIINASGDLTLHAVTISNTPNLTLTSGRTMSLLGAIGSSGNRLNSITITNGGALTLSGGIYTVNNQGYAGNITLSGATTLDSSAGQITQTGTIALAGSSLTVNTVNAISLGTLTTTTPANVSLTTTDGTNGTISVVAYGTSNNPIGALTITNAALNIFNGNVYATSVAVSGATEIRSNVIVQSSGAQSFGNINSQAGNNFTLALNTGSTLALGSVGVTQPVGALNITNTGNATLNGNLVAVIGTPTTTGNISLSGPAVINASRTINAGGDLTLNAVTISNTPDLTLSSGRTMTLSGALGSSGNRLNSIIITNSGTLSLSGGIYTVQTQTLNGSIGLIGNTTLDSSTGAINQTGNVLLNNFNLIVNGTTGISLGAVSTTSSGVGNLTLTTTASPGTISVTSIGTSSVRIGNLIINNFASYSLNTLYASSVQVTGASILNSNTTIVTTGSQSYGTIDSAVSTNYTLTLEAGTTITTGAIGSTTPPGDISIKNGGAGIISGPITSVGNLSFIGTGSLTLTQSVTLTGSGKALNVVQSPVLLAGTSATFTTNNGNITFGSTIDNPINLGFNAGTGTTVVNGNIGYNSPIGNGTGFSLTILSSGPTTFQGINGSGGITQSNDGLITFNGDITLDGMGTNSFLNGSAVLAGIDIITGVSLQFGNVTSDTITLTGNTNITVNNNRQVAFIGSLDGNYNLTVSSTGSSFAFFGGPVGSTTPLANLTINGSTRISTANVNVQNGAMNFNGPVTLNVASTLANTGSGIFFNSTIDGTRNLTLNTPGNILFNLAVGGTTRLSNLSISNANNVTANSTINALSLTQSAGTGTSTFNGAITTPSTVSGGVISITNVGGITFNSSINTLPPSSGGSITLTTNGPIILGQVEGTGTTLTCTCSTFNFTSTLGAAGALGDISVNNSGAGVVTNNITSSGNLSFVGTGSVGLTNTMTLTGAGTFNVTQSPVLLNGSQVSIITNNGNIFFGGTINNPTSLVLNSGSGAITVNGNVGYNSSIGNGTNPSITFQSTGNISVQGIRANGGFTQTGNGTITFNGNVLIASTGPDTLISGSSVFSAISFTTNGSIQFGDAISDTVVLNGDTSIICTASNKTFTFFGPIDGNYNLLVNSGSSGAYFFKGPVGNTTPLASLTVASGGTCNIQTGIINAQGGTLTFNSPVILSIDPTTFTDTGSTGIFFNSTVDGAVDLILDANGTGDILFNQAVGNATPLLDLTISDAKNVTANSTIKTQSFSQTTGTGSSTFNGAVTTLNAGTGGNVTLNTAGSIAFNNLINTQSTSAGQTGGNVQLTSTGANVTVTNVVTSGTDDTTTGGNSGDITLQPDSGMYVGSGGAGDNEPDGVLYINGSLTAKGGLGITPGLDGAISLSSAGRVSLPSVATIASSPSGNNITMEADTIFIGANEVFTVLGSLTMTANEITLRDTNSVGAIQITAPVINVSLHAMGRTMLPNGQLGTNYGAHFASSSTINFSSAPIVTGSGPALVFFVVDTLGSSTGTLAAFDIMPVSPFGSSSLLRGSQVLDTAFMPNGTPQYVPPDTDVAGFLSKVYSVPQRWITTFHTVGPYIDPYEEQDDFSFPEVQREELVKFKYNKYETYDLNLKYITPNNMRRLEGSSNIKVSIINPSLNNVETQVDFNSPLFSPTLDGYNLDEEINKDN